MEEASERFLVEDRIFLVSCTETTSKRRVRGSAGTTEMMDEKRLVKLSKYLSRHLRHQPRALGLTLEPGGWVAVETLLAAMARHGMTISRAELDEIVARNNKQR